MANAVQASDLKGTPHDMHGIAEQIGIMNEINARMVLHIAMNNLPHITAPIPKDVG